MRSLLFVSSLIIAATAPAFAADEHHSETGTSVSEHPPGALPPVTNAQGQMMADCPMMKDGKMMQGSQGMGGSSQGGMMQGNSDSGAQGGQQMMQDGKMQCPMM